MKGNIRIEMEECLWFIFTFVKTSWQFVPLFHLCIWRDICFRTDLSRSPYRKKNLLTRFMMKIHRLHRKHQMEGKRRKNIIILKIMTGMSDASYSSQYQFWFLKTLDNVWIDPNSLPLYEHTSHSFLQMTYSLFARDMTDNLLPAQRFFLEIFSFLLP